MTGIRTLESIKNATTEIAKACEKNQISKIMLDLKEYRQGLSTMEIYTLASTELSKIIKGKIKKVAIIDSEDFDERIRFFETVARNRGRNVKFFHKMEDALDWL